MCHRGCKTRPDCLACQCSEVPGRDFQEAQLSPEVTFPSFSEFFVYVDSRWLHLRVSWNVVVPVYKEAVKVVLWT